MLRKIRKNLCVSEFIYGFFLLFNLTSNDSDTLSGERGDKFLWG